MAITAQNAAQILFGSYKFVTANQVAIGVDVATLDVTNFSSGGFSTFVPGLKTLRLNLGGFNDFAVGAFDEYFRTGTGALQVVTVSPGAEATGTTAVITQGIPESDNNFNAKVGDVSKVAFAVKPVGQVIAEGQVTQVTTGTITTTGATTPVNLGNLGAVQQAYAAIHVVAIAGTAVPTITFTIQSSATSGGSYTSRGSAGAGITAVGGQFISTGVLGAIAEPWWKLAYVVSGTNPAFTVFASLAIF